MDPQRRQELEERLLARPSIDTAVDPDNHHKDVCEWRALQNYSAAIDLNRLFIKGKRQSSVTHWGPLAPETSPLIPGLLRLHDYGFLTYDSQPFLKKIKLCHSPKGAYWYECRQRPYLDFLLPQYDRIPAENIATFTTLLLAHPRIVTMIDEQEDTFRTNIKMDSHDVTEVKLALTVEELAAEPLLPYTSIPRKAHHEAQQMDVEAIHGAQCLDIKIASRSWEKDLDILALVEGVAIAAGMGRVYKETV